MNLRGAESILLAGEQVQLLPERALYWPAGGLLAVADLHWCKSETFRRHGIPIPLGILDSDLARLEAAARQTHAERIVVLGDLVHAARDVVAEARARIEAFRSRLPLPFALVRGNHDRAIDALAKGLGIDLHEGELDLAPFLLRHDPLPRAGRFVLAGHIHPTFRLSGAGDALRLPCFHVDRRGFCVLPAFSAFTAGENIHPVPGDYIHAVAGDAVVRVWP